MKNRIPNGTLPAWLLVSLLLVPAIGTAHTDNEATLFPDIQSSAARFDIILLAGIGIIPVTGNFHPENRLSRLALAAWGALAAGLGEAGDVPDVQALAGKAMDSGIIDDLDGNATYDDINRVLFKGRLNPDSPAATPTREDAARYIAANLESGTGGDTLLDRMEMYFGPTGEITGVESRMNPDGGTSFFVTIAGETHPFYSHGKLANGPTDLEQWQERTVRRSVIRNLGQLKLWIFLEADDESHADHQHSH